MWLQVPHSSSAEEWQTEIGDREISHVRQQVEVDRGMNLVSRCSHLHLNGKAGLRRVSVRRHRESQNGLSETVGPQANAK